MTGSCGICANYSKDTEMVAIKPNGQHAMKAWCVVRNHYVWKSTICDGYEEVKK